MIYYNSNAACCVSNLLRCKGSVIPWSCCLAFPCSLIAGFLGYVFPDRSMSFWDTEKGVLNETQAWSGFTFLVGFLIVFRTSQAYSRFWEGCTASYQMRAEWFDAAASVVAFCKHSKAPAEQVVNFQQLLVRLVSMLHASALADLETGSDKDREGIGENIMALSYEIIGAEGIDSKSIATIKECREKTELLFSWVQQLIVENIDTGVLSIPAPILSRAFQELANGMVQFHSAMKIAYIPFPFPYAQICDLLLVLHWVVVPVVTSQWTTNPLWAVVFTFIQVFILWSLNMIAAEIENPFGRDANDIDGAHTQEELNASLRLLLSPGCQRTARMRKNTPLEAEAQSSQPSESPHESRNDFATRGRTSTSFNDLLKNSEETNSPDHYVRASSFNDIFMRPASEGEDDSKDIEYERNQQAAKDLLAVSAAKDLPAVSEDSQHARACGQSHRRYIKREAGAAREAGASSNTPRAPEWKWSQSQVEENGSAGADTAAVSQLQTNGMVGYFRDVLHDEDTHVQRI